MAKEIPWTRSLRFKLGGIALLMLGLSLSLVVTNLYGLGSLRENIVWANYAAKGSASVQRSLYLAERLLDQTGDARTQTEAQLRAEAQNLVDRLRVLRSGDPGLGIASAADPRILANLERRADRWRTQIGPLLEKIITMPNRESARADLASLEQQLEDHSNDNTASADLSEEIVATKVARYQTAQFLYGGVVLLVLAWILLTVRAVTSRARALAVTSERIANGELTLTAPVDGDDEFGMLADAFNTMTGKLRETLETEREGRGRLENLLEAVTETANSLASGVAEILAGTVQQASGAQEQAAAVAETGSTVDEVLQTSEQALQRARAVTEASQRTMDVSKTGRKAVDDLVVGMGSVKEQVESIAESILGLAEQAQAIGEIIASVNDIAEQTNLLALNAGIEAARAGEHGRGFSVVASEVKALADQSKKATAQVRQILGDIQRATNSAVMSSEEGTKSMSSALAMVSLTGDSIRALTDTVSDAALAASQIGASASQQAAGMAQIHQAMKNISQVTTQNLASTRQMERAAKDLNALGSRLKGLLQG